MTIAFHLPFTDQKHSYLEQYISALVKNIIAEKTEHRFVFICTEKDGSLFEGLNNVETIFYKAGLFKKIWWKISLHRLLRKINADLFFYTDPVAVNTGAVKQLCLITSAERIQQTNFNHITSLVVMGQAAVNKFDNIVQKQKIKILSPSAIFNSKEAGDIFLTKEKYSGGKEYFFYCSPQLSDNDFIVLLKAFSHFKKRQQSSFRLLINTDARSFFRENIATYKYRDDVFFVEAGALSETAKLTAAAYAILLPFHTAGDSIAAMNAMQYGVPVIATVGSAIVDIAGDAVLTAEKANTKDLGDKMMRLYTDENFRNGQVAKGKQIAGQFTPEFAAGQLWKYILEALQ
jgi:glycosyltransferase involved in cell wall biosynthesis